MRASMTVLGARSNEAEKSVLASWKVGVAMGCDAFSPTLPPEYVARRAAARIMSRKSACIMEAVDMIPCLIQTRLKKQNEQQLEIEPLHRVVLGLQNRHTLHLKVPSLVKLAQQAIPHMVRYR